MNWKQIPVDDLVSCIRKYTVWISWRYTVAVTSLTDIVAPLPSFVPQLVQASARRLKYFHPISMVHQ